MKKYKYFVLILTVKYEKILMQIYNNMHICISDRTTHSMAYPKSDLRTKLSI